jgi:hypothetical protein
MSGPQPDEEETTHKSFLLNALRAASLRCKTMEADITTIGVALKGDLIGADTAVAWIKDANLMWMVGAIPEVVGRVAASNETKITLEVTDAA